jgi:diacylglycerol kinase family enzyme
MDLILYNPKSKNSRGNVQTNRLIKKYKKRSVPFRLKSILKLPSLDLFLKEHKEFEKIILLGGDGTIHHLTNQLVNYPKSPTIYVKKNGSGNDFLRTLKLQHKNPQFIMHCRTDEEEHYFINGTGIGVDGLVIDYVDKSKNKTKLSYFLASLHAMINFVPEPLTLELDGEIHHFKKAYTLMINNGMYVGGGMKMTRKARIDDEYLDVLVVHKIPKIFLILIFSLVYLGLHTKFKSYVFYKKAKHIKGTFTTPQFGQSDGEIFRDITSIEVYSSKKQTNYKPY